MKQKLFKFSAVILLCVVLAFQGTAQEGYVPSQENLDNREWFQDAKYGLFVHWGV